MNPETSYTRIGIIQLIGLSIKLLDLVLFQLVPGVRRNYQELSKITEKNEESDQRDIQKLLREQGQGQNAPLGQ